MRDSDLVVRAQLAASALEGAWRRWRVVHGDMADPMPAVSSYVGYSLQEPWGQPRVVLGIAAQDAEQLAALIERHDRGEPALAAAVTQPGVRDRPAWTGAGVGPAPVPMQAPSASADTGPRPSLAGLRSAGGNPGYDEPVYRQAAAAMKEATAAREDASRANRDGAEAADDRADPIDPEWVGALARAASTARVEAEARIRATLTEPADAGREAVPDDAKDLDAGQGQDCDFDEREAVDEGMEHDDHAAGPHDESRIGATDVLEPLPRPEPVAGEGGLGRDAARPDSAGRAVSGREVHDEDDEAPEDEAPEDEAPEPDDHEVAASVQTQVPARAVRLNRGSPAARQSKTKRPGACAGS